jgi:hypothetical protein
MWLTNALRVLLAARTEHRLTVAELASLHDRWLERCAPALDEQARTHWRRKAACAFYQSGLRRHRQLFLAEVITDFAAAGSSADPSQAVLETGLLEAPNQVLIDEI